MSDDARLERIEKKLDEVGQAIVALARMEERIITMFKRMDSYDETQREIGKRVGYLEKSTNTNGQMLRFAERLFWIVASSVVAYFAIELRGGQ
jgi:hypothetical protein